MSIISINGKISSGKDTIGKIIQYLTSDWADEEFEDTDMLDIRSDWKIKKFAGKLKQIASLLIGIPIEMFEDQEFKKSLLGEQWGTVRVNPLNAVPVFEDIQFNELMSVRELLQKLGTEAMRDGLHTNVWVNALFADYHPTSNKSMEDSFKEQFLTGRSEIHYKLPNWIITDMRFPNEIEAVKERKGITIRVVRPNTYNSSEKIKKSDLEESINIGLGIQSNHYIHPSETSLDKAKFDYEIINDGTMEELVEKVREILITEKII